jgi:hypothetical protein
MVDRLNAMAGGGPAPGPWLAILRQPYVYVGNNPVNENDPSGQSPLVIACVGACGLAALGCLAPGVIACGASTSSWEDFSKCMKNYWDLLPTWEKWVCGGLTAACLLCGLKWLIGKKPPKPPQQFSCAPCAPVINLPPTPIGPPGEQCFIPCTLLEQTLVPPCVCI